MRTTIQSESQRVSAKLVTNHSSDTESIQFSDSMGNDKHQGRLWTDSQTSTAYNSICRAVKKDAAYDRDTGLWVKRAAHAEFQAYKKQKALELATLVEQNRKYAIDVLGARIENRKG